MIKPAQSRDKGLGDEPGTSGTSIAPAAPSATMPGGVRKQWGSRGRPILHEGMGAGAMEMRDKWVSCTHRDQITTGGLCQGTNNSCHGSMARGEQQTGKGDTVTWQTRQMWW